MSIGRVIAGRYELVERLGTGAFFQVFRGRERTTGLSVAVKIVQPDLMEDAAFCHALRESARGSLDLDHPSIARTLEVVEEDGAPVIVTEFVRGINLKERIRRIAPFTVSVAVDFAVAICEALQYAHSAGKVHGDLRPQNVMVTPDGVAKVTDFGLAQAIAASSNAGSRNLSAAVHYQGPERSLQGVSFAATDLYALGVMLFEMLTGAPPYPADTPIRVALRHQNDPVPSPRDHNAGVPRALDGIVRKAMQKRPEDRYASAGDMLADLKHVRDALRFGRPIAWSPMDGKEPEVRPPAEAVAAEPPPEPSTRRAGTHATARAPEVTMPRRDDGSRLSPVLRVLLMLMGSVVLLLIFLGIGLWMAAFTKPEVASFPDLVGKRIEDARTEATKLKIRLVEREEYNDQYDPGIVFRVDYEPGRPIRPGRAVLTWVSKGSRLVWVPDVTGLAAAEAESKLKEAGLGLGQVDRQTSETVAFGTVISQNPRSGKRVERGTPVNVVLSDGPPEGSLNASGAGAEVAGGEHMWQVRHRVRRDGRGMRQVRIEIEDDGGTRTVFDEARNEGDEVDLQVRATGAELRVRVYYDDNLDPITEQVVPWRSPR